MGFLLQGCCGCSWHSHSAQNTALYQLIRRKLRPPQLKQDTHTESKCEAMAQVESTLLLGVHSEASYFNWTEFMALHLPSGFLFQRGITWGFGVCFESQCILGFFANSTPIVKRKKIQHHISCVLLATKLLQFSRCSSTQKSMYIYWKVTVKRHNQAWTDKPETVSGPF